MIKKWKNVKKIKKKKTGKLQFPKKWKIAIFLEFFSFFLSLFFHFFSFFSFFIFYHFFFQWCKNFPKNKKLQFSSSCFHFFIIFYHFLSFLLPVVELMKNDKKKGWKMLKKLKKNEKNEKKKLAENCNFPKNEKLQFSSSFFHFFSVFSFFFHFFIFLTFHHFSSFLLPVVQKFSEK